MCIYIYDLYVYLSFIQYQFVSLSWTCLIQKTRKDLSKVFSHIWPPSPARDVHSLVFVNYLALAAVVTSPILGFAFEETWLRRPSPWALTLLFLLASLASLGETLLAVGLKMESAAKVTWVFWTFSMVFKGYLGIMLLNNLMGQCVNTISIIINIYIYIGACWKGRICARILWCGLKCWDEHSKQKTWAHYVYLKSIWNHLEATSMNYLQVVFAFFFQGEVLHETASDQLSQLGAALISAWGVVALTKETLAPEEDPKTEPLLKRWDEKIIREDMRSTSIWLLEMPKSMPKCWRSEVIRRGDKKWETKVGLNVLYRFVFCLSIRQAHRERQQFRSSPGRWCSPRSWVRAVTSEISSSQVIWVESWKRLKKRPRWREFYSWTFLKQVWGFIVGPVLWTFFCGVPSSPFLN